MRVFRQQASVTALHVVLLVLVLSCLIPSCNAADDSANGIARRIFAIELEMQKVNYHLHLEAANPSFRRARRTWLWDIGNGLATEGGLISATSIFFKHVQDKTTKRNRLEFEKDRYVLKTEIRRMHNEVNGKAIAGTLYPQIAGQAFGGTGALFELSSDVARSIRLRRDLLNGDAITATIVAMNTEADKLLGQLQSSEPTSENEVKLLTEIKRKILVEFVRLQAQAGNISAGQYIEDGSSLVRNTVGLIGNSINAYAVLHNNRRLNGEGTILNLVAASLITVRPLISNIGAHLVKKKNEKSARRYFPEVERAGSEIESLVEAVNAGASSKQQLDRIALYRRQVENLNDEASLADFENRRLKQIAVRRYRETIYGPTKQTQAILGLIIGFQGGNNATRDNRLAAAGNTTYMTGQAFNISELIRERTVDEHAHAKQKRDGLLPEQRLDKQLATVEQLQKLCTQGL